VTTRHESNALATCQIIRVVSQYGKLANISET